MSDKKLSRTLKAYADLTRIQFGFAWPLLFCSGVFLGSLNYGGFSWETLVKAILIALCGFEAGLVLNDYVDREYDSKDVEENMTKYWRAFNTRPLPVGSLSSNAALTLFILLVAFTILLIATLPFPHSLYLIVIMTYCYGMEYFYQIKKRHQRYPIAQLLGRTDFALFPVAGYLMVGHPDVIALLYFLFFYPFAVAHLAVNDLADVENDSARGLKSVTVLYGINGTVLWILLFTTFHYLAALLFLTHLGLIAWVGFGIGFLLLAVANIMISRKKTPQAGLKSLPLFHVTMIIYSLSLIIYVVL